jgi:hypothetical protein
VLVKGGGLNALKIAQLSAGTLDLMASKSSPGMLDREDSSAFEERRMNRAQQPIKLKPELPAAPVRPGLLQRKCGCGGSAGLAGECEECGAEKLSLQRSARNGERNAQDYMAAPPIVHEVLNSTGNTLDQNTRQFMESRFAHDFSRIGVSSGLQASGSGLQVGPVEDPHEREADMVAGRVMGHSESPSTTKTDRGFDFSNVRIHADARAAESARSVAALAYTVGRDIVFGEGQYRPHTMQGQRLLAHELAHVAQQGATSTPARTQRQPVLQRTRVTLSTEGRCPDATKIAEAIPGARAMADTASHWFISLGERDRARVNLLLRANFLSDSDSVHVSVSSRVASIGHHLASAQAGRITFVCADSTDTNCGDREGYVMDNEPDRIHLCPPFFNLTLEGRRWMLVHECAHLAGARRLPESYYAMFGEVGEEQCRQGSVSATTQLALENADNYARLIWCLTKPPGLVITPPTATP